MRDVILREGELLCFTLGTTFCPASIFAGGRVHSVHESSVKEEQIVSQKFGPEEARKRGLSRPG